MSHAAPVRVITISREFGAGATGLGARLAQALGWKLWDKDVLRGVSEVLGNPVPELAQIDEREAEATLRHRLHSRPAHRAHLAALREWMEMIAEQGKAIGPQGQKLVQGAQHIGGPLPGQAVHDVEIDRGRTKHITFGRDEDVDSYLQTALLFRKILEQSGKGWRRLPSHRAWH